MSKNLYPNIEAERARNGYSKQELVRQLGSTLQTYRNWQSGRTSIPSKSLSTMAELFAVSTDYLLSRTEQP